MIFHENEFSYISYIRKIIFIQEEIIREKETANITLGLSRIDGLI